MDAPREGEGRISSGMKSSNCRAYRDIFNAIKLREKALCLVEPHNRYSRPSVDMDVNREPIWTYSWRVLNNDCGAPLHIGYSQTLT